MDNGVQLALIASLGPMIVMILQYVLSARKARADNDRADQVAARVAEAADQAADAAILLVRAQKDTIARTDEVARKAEESTGEIRRQLVSLDEQGKVIHDLVNSDMTQVLTDERDQTRLTLLALKRVQALSQKLGVDVDQAELTTMATTEARLVKLDAVLADRIYKQRAIDRTRAEAAAAPLGATATQSLANIDKQTKVIAENTAHTDAALTELNKEK